MSVPRLNSSLTSQTISVYNDFLLPLDPSALHKMSEYNLSLLLFKTIFYLGKESIPKSKIFTSWSINENKKLLIGEISDSVK